MSQNDISHHDRIETPSTSGLYKRPQWRRNLIRIVVGLVILAVIAGVIGAIAYRTYRSSRSKPIKVDTYPGAQQITDEDVYPGYDHQQYISSDPIEQIEAFYDDQDSMKCERQYDYQQEPALYLFTSCIVDRSSLNMTQYTKVVIQPAADGAGVIIDVQRHWED